MGKLLIRIVLFLVLGFVLFCGAYFVKSRLPFEFSTEVSIHQYFPFNYLARKDTFELSIPGLVLADNFDDWPIFSRWYHIWAKERDKVAIQPDDNGFRGSGCLSVVSRSQKSWSISPAVYIEVAPGTPMVFEAALKKDLEEQRAGLRLVGLDRNKQPMDTRLAQAEMTGPFGQWESLKINVTVPEGIAYVTPRIRGIGMGKIRVDNIRVVRQ